MFSRSLLEAICLYIPVVGTRKWRRVLFPALERRMALENSMLKLPDNVIVLFLMLNILKVLFFLSSSGMKSFHYDFFPIVVLNFITMWAF